MKKLLLSSAFIACLATALVSFWVVANPTHALAASGTATCANGQEIHCSAANSQCIAQDATDGVGGYCICVANGPNGGVTDEHWCTNSDEEPLYD
jgi:hypothetical protein